MNEIEEIRLRNAFFQAIMEFFHDHTPFPIEGMNQPVADLTDKLIDAYENTTRVDTN
jgi:hypothetical protein